MTRKAIAWLAVGGAFLLAREAGAQQQYVSQSDSPQWLKDRRFNEGAGIRTSDLELHPGVAAETGYDSNWFLRSPNSTTPAGNQITNGPPVSHALVLRITPSLYLSTLGAQRREGDTAAAPPAVAFRAGINATYWQLFNAPGWSGQHKDDVTLDKVPLTVATDARLDIAPERPLNAALLASYGRTIQPNGSNSDPNFAFDRDDIGVGAEIGIQPGGGTIDWRFGYSFHDTLFENNGAATATLSAPSAFNNVQHQAFTRGRWRFRPRSMLLYDASVSFVSYADENAALANGLVSATPLRARIGVNTLLSDRFSLLAMAGWGASFEDTSQLPGQQQYDSVIGQAELRWFLAASPGIASAADVGLTLSSIAVGYTRDFQNSLLGGFSGMDRGYLKLYYFFAGRALVTLEGGVGAVEYPDIIWGPQQGGGIRATAFTDTRADATVFGEYRFSNSFALNATLRYTQNFSNTQIREDPTVSQYFDMAWQRFEAFLGVRWFL